MKTCTVIRSHVNAAISKVKEVGRSVYLASFRWFVGLVVMRIVPDTVVRYGIRYLLSLRLKEAELPTDQVQSNKMKFVDELKSMPIAIETAAANEQHYELPTEYFTTVLGKWKKYSSCYYLGRNDSIDTAEENMLQIYCEKLKLADGMSVLELGCGWGSFTLYAAAKYPKCLFRAVSNSSTQRVYILQQAAERGLKNVAVTTADMNMFVAEAQYDRVVSVEMFEHMKNYGKLLEKVATWMKPDALFFCHVFCHKTIAPLSVQLAHEHEFRTLSIHDCEGGICISAHGPTKLIGNHAVPMKGFRLGTIKSAEDGKAVLHVRCKLPCSCQTNLGTNRTSGYRYHFEDNGDDDWMTRYFFSGGTMPSLDLFLYFQQHLAVESVSYVNGMHYSRTLEQWLQKQDRTEKQLMPLFKGVYGKEANKWIVYWRLFYIACSELFKYNGGEEYGLAHYVFKKVA